MSPILDLLNRTLKVWDTFYGKARNGLNHLQDALGRLSYRLGDRDPASLAYGAHRKAAIQTAIQRKTLSTGRVPEGYGRGMDERVVEYPWLFSRLDSKPGRLLDAGSVLNFDFVLRQPELASKQLTISTLAPESENFWWRGISYTFEDLRQCSFKDETFDWVVCLSTIEHVGMNNTVYTKDGSKKEALPQDAYAFLKELHRVLKPGGTLFLSFPFGKAAHHDWYQIFDLAAVEKMVGTFQPHMESQNYFRYDAKGWRSCAPSEAANATYGQRQHGHGPVAAEAIACLELVK